MSDCSVTLDVSDSETPLTSVPEILQAGILE